MGNARVALHQSQELILGNGHYRARLGGYDGCRARFIDKDGHGTENFVLLYITYLLAVNPGFGMTFDDDENMFGAITLANQFFAGSKVFKACGRTDVDRLDTCKSLGQQGGLSKQIECKKLLALFAAINVLEKVTPFIRGQPYCLVMAVLPAGQVKAVTKADKAALLQTK